MRIEDELRQAYRNLTDTQERCSELVFECRRLRLDARRIETSMQAILTARDGETAWQAGCRVVVELAEARAKLNGPGGV